VGKNISEAILKTSAGKNAPATYWDWDEQERRLKSMFNKWAERGDVWSAAADGVSVQNAHVSGNH
jgi:hypothetical protein